VSGRDRLLAALSPDLVAAIEELVEERVRAEVESVEVNGAALLSLADAADYLAVSARTLERLVAKKRIRTKDIGRRRLFRRADLDAFAEEATREDATPVTPPRRH
jgi:excisionase family DNA binding protein